MNFIIFDSESGVCFFLMWLNVISFSLRNFLPSSDFKPLGCFSIFLPSPSIYLFFLSFFHLFLLFFFSLLIFSSYTKTASSYLFFILGSSFNQNNEDGFWGIAYLLFSIWVLVTFVRIHRSIEWSFVNFLYVKLQSNIFKWPIFFSGLSIQALPSFIIFLKSLHLFLIKHLISEGQPHHFSFSSMMILLKVILLIFPPLFCCCCCCYLSSSLAMVYSWLLLEKFVTLY